MVRHTLKILQQMLQGFLSVSDHFTTLRSKRLITSSLIPKILSRVRFDYILQM